MLLQLSVIQTQKNLHKIFKIAVIYQISTALKASWKKKSICLRINKLLYNFLVIEGKRKQLDAQFIAQVFEVVQCCYRDTLRTLWVSWNVFDKTV